MYSGKKLELEVSQNMSIAALKLLISTHPDAEFPIDKQRIIFQGKEISKSSNDNTLISTLQLNAGSTIHLMKKA